MFPGLFLYGNPQDTMGNSGKSQKNTDVRDKCYLISSFTHELLDSLKVTQYNFRTNPSLQMIYVPLLEHYGSTYVTL